MRNCFVFFFSSYFSDTVHRQKRRNIWAIFFISVVCLAVIFVADIGLCNVATDDEKTKELLIAGDTALRKGSGHYQEALAKYTAALVSNPNSVRGLYSRAELLSILRRPGDSFKDLKRLLELDSDNHVALVLRFSLYLQAGQLQEAIDDAERLIALYKKLNQLSKATEYEKKVEDVRSYASIWVPLKKNIDAAKNGAVVLSTEDYAKCVAVLQDIIRDFGRDNVALRLQRAECALECSNSHAVFEELKYVMWREPQNLDAAAVNARAFRALGAIEKARAEVRRCLSLDPEHAACAKMHKLLREQVRVTSGVTAALEKKDFKKALELIEEAERFEKNPPYKEELLRWRCDVAVGLRDAEDGVGICSELIRLLGAENPLSFDVYLQKVELHILREDLASAEEDLRSAQKLQPNHNLVREYAHKIENLKRAAQRKDYYKILGVKKAASEHDIRRAYRTVSRKFHPDMLRQQKLSEKEREKAEKHYRDINEAREVLLDPEKRRQYDSGEDPTKPPGQQGGGNPFYGHPFTFQGDPFGQGGGQQFFFRFG